MKNLILSIFSLSVLVFISNPANGQSKESQYTISKDTVKLKFTPSQNFEDLALIKQKLKEVNVKLTYTFLRFNDNNNLVQISAKIEYPDGAKGSFSSRELKPNDSPGFNWESNKFRKGKK